MTNDRDDDRRDAERRVFGSIQAALVARSTKAQPTRWLVVPQGTYGARLIDLGVRR